MTVTLELPWPVTVNAYWRNIVVGRRARTIVSERGRKYQAAVVAKMLADHGEIAPMTGRLAVEVDLYPPTARQWDCDNMGKSLFDALTAANVWADDSQIDLLTYRRMPKRGPSGLAVVRISKIDTAAPARHDGPQAGLE